MSASICQPKRRLSKRASSRRPGCPAPRPKLRISTPGRRRRSSLSRPAVVGISPLTMHRPSSRRPSITAALLDMTPSMLPCTCMCSAEILEKKHRSGLTMRARVTVLSWLASTETSLTSTRSSTPRAISERWMGIAVLRLLSQAWTVVCRLSRWWSWILVPVLPSVPVTNTVIGLASWRVSAAVRLKASWMSSTTRVGTGSLRATSRRSVTMARTPPATMAASSLSTSLPAFCQSGRDSAK